MLFNSYVFVLLFLPLVLGGYFLIGHLSGRKLAHVWLVAASALFYGWFNFSYVWILVLSVVSNYGWLTLMRLARNHRPGACRTIMVLGVLSNLGLLGYYKYADFLIDNANRVLGTALTPLHVLLPLGISFFTFQQLSYLIDAYRNRVVDNIPFLEYVLFVTFFPQLIAGPIVHHGEMMPQFNRDETLRPRADNLAAGLYLFSLGLAKKVIIADQVAVWATAGFDQLPCLTCLQAWFTVLAYTFQIYFDFSGYCDMAIGLAKMFNIDLPVNFDSPYQARDIREFWNKWHMTLGRFLAHYVYFPLGGSKGGLARTCLNLQVTFLISGLWHGAGWSFVFWGGLHGLALVINRVWSAYGFQMRPALGRLITFLFVVVSFVAFRATTWADALKVWRGMVSWPDSAAGSLSELVSPRFSEGGAMLVLVALLAGCMLCPNAVERFRNFLPTRRTWAETVVYLAVSVLLMARISPFIYFNF